MDTISVTRMNTLHPVLRSEALAIVQALLDRGVEIRITSALRTPAEQDALFAQGRTAPGRIVTKAKAWQSFHNYGLAVDILLHHKDGSISYDPHEDLDKDGVADWNEAVQEFKLRGWEWAGDWKEFRETPHFQKSFSQSWITLKGLHDAGKVQDNYVILPNL